MNLLVATLDVQEVAHFHPVYHCNLSYPTPLVLLHFNDTNMLGIPFPLKVQKFPLEISCSSQIYVHFNNSGGRREGEQTLACKTKLRILQINKFHQFMFN